MNRSIQISILCVLLIFANNITAQVHFQVSPDTGCGTLSPVFTNLHPSNGYVVVPMQTTGFTYEWDFGNSQTSALENPTGINYTFPNTYAINYSVTVDTIGFFLTKLVVTEIGCDDPDIWPLTNDPDIYIQIIDGSNNIIYDTYSEADNHVVDPSNVNEIFLIPNLPMNNPPYYIRVRDKDSADTDDNCIDGGESETAGSFVYLPPSNQSGFYETEWNYSNGQLAFTLTINKPVFIFTETQNVVVLQQPSAPTLNYYQHTSCPGAPLPDLIATGSNIQWYDDASLTNLIASDSLLHLSLSQEGIYYYYATQTGTNGCMSLSATSEITISMLDAPVLSDTLIHFCTGESTPMIFATGFGINWYNDPLLTNLIHSGDTINIDSLSPGNYYFFATQTDSAGYCSSNPAALHISVIQGIEAVLNVTDASCYNGMDGIINAYVTDMGNSPFNFYWSDGSIDSLLTNVIPGEYSLTIMDKNFCIMILSAIINSPEELGISITKNNISCFGYADGILSATVDGGTEPYSYAWSNGNNDMTNSGLAPSTYDILITDANGCSITDNETINSPDIINISLTSVNESCNGSFDGEIHISVTGGIPPYMYTWPGNAYDTIASGIHSGIHEIKVTDYNGCIKDTSIALQADYESCLIPASVLTPNGDGKNDYWIIKFIELHPGALVSIFDRSGKLVFESGDYANNSSQAWNGSDGSKELAMGSYFYIINIDNEGITLKGTVDLIK